jgi:hypothetical protein
VEPGQQPIEDVEAGAVLEDPVKPGPQGSLVWGVGSQR